CAAGRRQLDLDYW
nr:immunoglobulin heavy chain junction region [Macaca mulatta]